MSLNDAPQSVRIHISFFGKTNSGKSSLVNLLTGQDYAIVSDIAGTTTDPVSKAMELPSIGPAVITDTAGFMDTTPLGLKRLEKTKLAFQKTDIIIFVTSLDKSETEILSELNFFKTEFNITKKIITVLNKKDLLENNPAKINLESLSSQIEKLTDTKPVLTDCKNKTGRDKLVDAILHSIPEDFNTQTLTKNLCTKLDQVLLVMPQDIQAPKGRLILPQVQVLRELLDKKCIVTCTTADTLSETLSTLKAAPKLIITDSQCFNIVWPLKPKDSLLTSFSILLAANKGNIVEFIKAADSIQKLNSTSRVLIAEACTHIPVSEDIGTKKIPSLLKKINPQIQITHSHGTDFPPLTDDDNKPLFDLIIHCGACMFNRELVLSRQKKAREANIPMTNYGIFLAAVNNILDKVSIPE